MLPINLTGLQQSAQTALANDQAGEEDTDAQQAALQNLIGAYKTNPSPAVQVPAAATTAPSLIGGAPPTDPGAAPYDPLGTVRSVTGDQFLDAWNQAHPNANLVPHPDPNHADNGFVVDQQGTVHNLGNVINTVASGPPTDQTQPLTLAQVQAAATGNLHPAATDAHNANIQAALAVSDQVGQHKQAATQAETQAQIASDAADAARFGASAIEPGMDKNDPDAQAKIQGQMALGMQGKIWAINVHQLGADGKPDPTKPIDPDATLAARQAYARSIGIHDQSVLDSLGGNSATEGHTSINDMADAGDNDAIALKSAWKGFKALGGDEAAQDKFLTAHGIDPDSAVGRAAKDSEDLDDTGTATTDAGSDYVNPADNRHKLGTKDILGGLAVALLGGAGTNAPGQEAIGSRAATGYMQGREQAANDEDQADQEQYARDVQHYGTVAGSYQQQAQQLAQTAAQHRAEAQNLGQQLVQGYGYQQQAQTAANALGETHAYHQGELQNTSAKTDETVKNDTIKNVLLGKKLDNDIAKQKASEAAKVDLRNKALDVQIETEAPGPHKMALIQERYPKPPAGMGPEFYQKMNNRVGTVAGYNIARANYLGSRQHYTNVMANLAPDRAAAQETALTAGAGANTARAGYIGDEDAFLGAMDQATLNQKTGSANSAGATGAVLGGQPFTPYHVPQLPPRTPRAPLKGPIGKHGKKGPVYSVDANGNLVKG